MVPNLLPDAIARGKISGPTGHRGLVSKRSHRSRKFPGIHAVSLTHCQRSSFHRETKHNDCVERCRMVPDSQVTWAIGCSRRGSTSHSIFPPDQVCELVTHHTPLTRNMTVAPSGLVPAAMRPAWPAFFALQPATLHGHSAHRTELHPVYNLPRLGSPHSRRHPRLPQPGCMR